MKPGWSLDHRWLELKKEAKVSDLGLAQVEKKREVRDILKGEERILNLVIYLRK